MRISRPIGLGLDGLLRPKRGGESSSNTPDHFPRLYPPLTGSTHSSLIAPFLTLPILSSFSTATLTSPVSGEDRPHLVGGQQAIPRACSISLDIHAGDWAVPCHYQPHVGQWER